MEIYWFYVGFMSRMGLSETVYLNIIINRVISFPVTGLPLETSSPCPRRPLPRSPGQGGYARTISHARCEISACCCVTVNCSFVAKWTLQNYVHSTDDGRPLATIGTLVVHYIKSFMVVTSRCDVFSMFPTSFMYACGSSYETVCSLVQLYM